MLNQTNDDTLDLLVRVPHKSRWERLPFGVRMTIGCTAVVMPLLAAGLAVAAVVQEPPAPQLSGVRAAAPAHGGTGAIGEAPAVPGHARPVVPPGGDAARAAGGLHSGTRPGPPTGTSDAGRADRTRAAVGGAAGTGPTTDRRGGPVKGNAAKGNAAKGNAAKGNAAKGNAAKGNAAKGNPAKGGPGKGKPGKGGPGKGGSANGGPVVGAPAQGAAPSAGPVTGTRLVTETRPIAFRTRWVADRSMPWGASRVQTPGQPGTRTMTYEVTTAGGRETGRKLVKSAVTSRPVTRVVAVGTRRGPGGQCRPRSHDCARGPADRGCPGAREGGGLRLGGDLGTGGSVRVLGTRVLGCDRG